MWSTLRDQGGRLWIGTESGLDYLPAGSNTPKVWQSPGVQTDRAASFAESADGSVWVGSAAGNLTRIDPHTLAGKQWKIPEVFRVLSDGDHRIWAATSGGLFVVDTSARDVSPQVEEAGIAHPRERFTDLTLDADDTLWAASDEGIYRRDGTGWHAIDAGLSAVIPMEIAADKNGILWAAGAFPGLMRLHVVKDSVVESEHVSRPHLLSDQVVSLELDHRGWLWVGQDAGLAVYDGQSWRSFTQDDGLIWNDTDSYAISEDRDGTMWIGTSAGLSHLLKPQAVPAAVPAAPVFSSIKFGNATIQNESEIPWSANPLTITVSALSYRDASHIRIRYRLLGVESEWVESSDRNIRYARLEPGPYRFQAIVVDDTGATTSAAESGTAGETVSPVEEVSFVITPQWWQSSPLRNGVAMERTPAGAAEEDSGKSRAAPYRRSGSGEGGTVAGAGTNAPFCRARRFNRSVEPSNYCGAVAAGGGSVAPRENALERDSGGPGPLQKCERHVRASGGRFGFERGGRHLPELRAILRLGGTVRGRGVFADSAWLGICRSAGARGAVAHGGVVGAHSRRHPIDSDDGQLRCGFGLPFPL